MFAVRWTGCESIQSGGITPIHIGVCDKWLHGRNSLKQRQAWRYARKIRWRVIWAETGKPALMQIGLSIVRFHHIGKLEVISMPKQKPSTQIHVADGTGGMRPVLDHRFEAGPWPIEFVIPTKDADSWMAHLDAEMKERGWSASGISQIDVEENSGTLSVHVANGPSPPTLHIVWEKPRGADLCVKARPDGNPIIAVDLAREFIDAINKRAQERITARAHRWDMLTYEGLPWRGELWLGDDIRLGPPSRCPDALIGPQVVIIDAMVEGIGPTGIAANFQTRIQELRIFLGIVLEICAKPVRPKHGWVAQFDEHGRPTACTLQSTGYWEVGPPRTFPVKGSCPPVPREAVTRPGTGRTGIWPDMSEEWVPADVEELWRAFTALPAAKRENLLHAGNAYLIARSMWPDQRTAYAAFLVVACEALKPTGKRYDKLNVYDVVASLLSPSEAERLRKHSAPPQQVRSKHLHRGELAAGELLPILIQDYFADPSFDEMLGELSRVCRVCLIEWLRRRGEYVVVRASRPKPGRVTGRAPRAGGGGAKTSDLTPRSTRTRRKRCAG